MQHIYTYHSKHRSIPSDPTDFSVEVTDTTSHALSSAMQSLALAHLTITYILHSDTPVT